MNFLKTLSLMTLTTTWLSACGPGDRLQPYDGPTGSGIVNAAKVDLTQDVLARGVPHLLIYPSGDTERSCTGTLIGDQVILTAAHCVEDLEKRLLKPMPLAILNQGDDAITQFGYKNFPVVAAQSVAAADAEILAVEVAIHPNFLVIGNTLDSDVALIRLARPVRSSAVLPKIKLDSQDLGKKIGAKVFAYGYGMTATSSKDGEFRTSNDGQMRRKDFVVVKTTYLSQYLDMSDSFMVENPNHKLDGGLCQGDSGGPVLAQTASGPVVVGVVSKAIGTCSGSAVLKSVSFYRSWILRTAASWKLQLY